MSQTALRIGMLGGTFDPIHLGHLRSAVELYEALSLDRLHMIPAQQPPLRGRPQVSAKQRLALLTAGIGDTPGSSLMTANYAATVLHTVPLPWPSCVLKWVIKRDW